MEFQLYRRYRDATDSLSGVLTEEVWSWKLKAKDGVVIAVGPENYRTEDAVRRNIASFRKASKGVKFARVVEAVTG